MFEPTGAQDQPALDELIALLDLDEVEPDHFCGRSPRTTLQRVFGGQVAGQALVAAGRTVDPARHVHSLHSYFIRGGDPGVPIEYVVDRARDGGSFSIRRVVAQQHEKTIFVLSASFQLEQPGFEHQATMPDVPAPETLPNVDGVATSTDMDKPALFSPRAPLDIRYVDLPSWARAPDAPPSKGPQSLWLRANGELPDDPLLHVCLLTYASDMALLDTALVRQGLNAMSDELSMASLDHAMWFHRPFRADDWLLYTMRSPAASGGRALATGRFFDRVGRHLVSVAQEGMIRVREARPGG